MAFRSQNQESQNFLVQELKKQVASWLYLAPCPTIQSPWLGEAAWCWLKPLVSEDLFVRAASSALTNTSGLDSAPAVGFIWLLCPTSFSVKLVIRTILCGPTASAVLLP